MDDFFHDFLDMLQPPTEDVVDMDLGIIPAFVGFFAIDNDGKFYYAINEGENNFFNEEKIRKDLSEHTYLRSLATPLSFLPIFTLDYSPPSPRLRLVTLHTLGSRIISLPVTAFDFEFFGWSATRGGKLQEVFKFLYYLSNIPTNILAIDKNKKVPFLLKKGEKEFKKLFLKSV